MHRAFPDAARLVPWVRDASVRRLYPDAVEIRFTTYEAMARWDEKHLVSREGAVFEARDASALPRFRGPCLDLGHEPGPAGITVLAGDSQLGGGESHRPWTCRGRAGGDPGLRGRVPGPGGVTELLGPAAELVQARPGR